jgi:hypothetical protein
LSESNEVESHVPLLGEYQVSQLNALSTGLDLNRSCDQIRFLNQVQESGVEGVTVDGIVEYLVEVADVKIGNIDPIIKLSPDCNPARRLHVARVQVMRHKTQETGQPANMQVSNEMVVSNA